MGAPKRLCPASGLPSVRRSALLPLLHRRPMPRRRGRLPSPRIGVPPPAQESRSQPQKAGPSERRGQEKPPAIAAPPSRLLRPLPLSGRRGGRAEGSLEEGTSPLAIFPPPASIGASCRKRRAESAAVAGVFSSPRRRFGPTFCGWLQHVRGGEGDSPDWSSHGFHPAPLPRRPQGLGGTHKEP